jgi:hypothetical protein
LASIEFWKVWPHNLKATAKDKKVNIAVTYSTLLQLKMLGLGGNVGYNITGVNYL